VKPVGVAVIGAGYWGPNLVRNFRAVEGADLRWVCDLDRDRGLRAIGPRSTVRVTDSLDDVLNDDDVEAVAVATPVATHAEIALACLEAGKHVLMEKPLALSVAEGEKVVEAAQRLGQILMCDHTYCYTPAVRRIRELTHDGTIGRVQYVDSVRINLGIVQRDVDVLWDLAPHDLSILDFILPEGCVPLSVAAHGADPIGAGRACIGYLTLPLSGGGIAHVHVNWLSPTKIRTTIVGGSKRIVVWDDLHPTQRLSMYDKGVEFNGGLGQDARREKLVSYRVGDMVAPALPEQEALHAAVEEFLTAIMQRRSPLTDGHSGLRVLRILEAAGASIELAGAAVPLDAGTRTGETGHP
jgi:predicted dehydrogenase